MISSSWKVGFDQAVNRFNDDPMLWLTRPGQGEGLLCNGRANENRPAGRLLLGFSATD